MTTYAPPLYANTTSVDEKTGLPQDYESLFAAYRDTVTNAARRLRMPSNDWEDGAQEVQLKFWQKDGLSLFDTSRPNRFTAFYRQWTTLFMLQERDKSMKFIDRFLLVDNHTDLDTSDQTVTFENEAVSNKFVEEWIERAEKALYNSGYANLVPLLHTCFSAAQRATTPTKDEISQATGRASSSSSLMMKKLRSALQEVGMGMESLYE